MLKLKLQYFGHVMWRTDSLEKTLMLGKAGGEGDDRGWDGWMASLTQWTWVWVNSRVGDGQGSLACCSSWGCKEADMTEPLNLTTEVGSVPSSLSSGHLLLSEKFPFESQRYRDGECSRSGLLALQTHSCPSHRCILTWWSFPWSEFQGCVFCGLFQTQWQVNSNYC